MIKKERLIELIKQHKTIFADGFGRVKLNENKTNIRFYDGARNSAWCLYYDINEEDFTHFEFADLYELKELYQVFCFNNGKKKVLAEAVTEAEAEMYREIWAKRKGWVGVKKRGDSK